MYRSYYYILLLMRRQRWFPVSGGAKSCRLYAVFWEENRLDEGWGLYAGLYGRAVKGASPRRAAANRNPPIPS